MSQANAKAAAKAPAPAPAPALTPALSGQPAESMQRFTKFVGLDVHKRTVVACVLGAAGRTLHREQFACTAAELQRFAREHMGPHVAAALEATTNTWAVCNGGTLCDATFWDTARGPWDVAPVRCELPPRRVPRQP